MRFILVIAVIFTSATQCVVPIIRTQELKSVNSEWQNVVFQAREDIGAAYNSGGKREEDIIFRKNARVKIWIESSSEWIKVKAFPAEDKREQARGRIIIYIFKDDLGDHNVLDFLKEKILALLNPIKP